MLPGTLQDRLTLGAKYASGKWKDSSFAQFAPLTVETQGQVLRTNLSGLTIIDAGYTARLLKTLALDVSCLYFVRNDLYTYSGAFVDEPEYFLGGEVFLQLIYSPLSDIRCNVGAGAFFPQLGNTAPDSKASFLVNLSISIAIL
jgi:hypothetical protein